MGTGRGHGRCLRRKEQGKARLGVCREARRRRHSTRQLSAGPEWETISCAFLVPQAALPLLFPEVKETSALILLQSSERVLSHFQGGGGSYPSSDVFLLFSGEISREPEREV